MNILVLESDRRKLRFLVRALAKEGYVVDACATVATALRHAIELPYDVLVLQWTLPGCDGLRVCRRVRRNGSRTPVLILSARNDVREKVAALDAGADDYLTRPFALPELLARIRVALRRSQRFAEGRVVAGGLELRVEQRAAFLLGARLHLSGREFALLELLVRNAGRVVSRSMMLDRVWEMHHDPGSNVIDVHIRNIRVKLGDAASKIETIRGQGYRFRVEGA
ncbi:MAG: response regulator transcription factor [Deltaproteobacteria bacterium]|nr:response regulator transcription factor [Deltaproteobacteria bacterium]